MERNVGSWDRILRVGIGIVALTLMFVGPKTVLELFGIIPLLTGLAGHCPIYSMFGISTCPGAKRVRRRRAATI